MSVYGFTVVHITDTRTCSCSKAHGSSCLYDPATHTLFRVFDFGRRRPPYCIYPRRRGERDPPMPRSGAKRRPAIAGSGFGSRATIGSSALYAVLRSRGCRPRTPRPDRDGSIPFLCRYVYYLTGRYLLLNSPTSTDCDPFSTQQAPRRGAHMRA